MLVLKDVLLVYGEPLVYLFRAGAPISQSGQEWSDNGVDPRWHLEGRIEKFFGIQPLCRLSRTLGRKKSAPALLQAESDSGPHKV